MTQITNEPNTLDETRIPRGCLIVLEGGDRCGKSTQVSLLESHLKSVNIPFSTLKFPDRTSSTGKVIDAYLQNAVEINDQVIHLLFSANRWESAAKIKSLVEVGEVVICDRYAFSGVSYSCAKGLDLKWCKQPDVGLPRPDLVLFMDLDPLEAAKRGDYGLERYEKIAFQQQVHRVFQELKDKTWINVDASMSVEAISSVINKKVMTVVSECHSNTKLKQLWI